MNPPARRRAAAVDTFRPASQTPPQEQRSSNAVVGGEAGAVAELPPGQPPPKPLTGQDYAAYAAERRQEREQKRLEEAAQLRSKKMAVAARRCVGSCIAGSAGHPCDVMALQAVTLAGNLPPPHYPQVCGPWGRLESGEGNLRWRRPSGPPLSRLHHVTRGRRPGCTAGNKQQQQRTGRQQMRSRWAPKHPPTQHGTAGCACKRRMRLRRLVPPQGCPCPATRRRCCPGVLCSRPRRGTHTGTGRTAASAAQAW